LTYFHIYDMVFHTKTTLNINGQLMRLLKREAAQRGKTMSEMVENALRLFLQERPPLEALPELPSFNGGGARVDVADRESLYQAMEGR